MLTNYFLFNVNKLMFQMIYILTFSTVILVTEFKETLQIATIVVPDSSRVKPVDEPVRSLHTKWVPIWNRSRVRPREINFAQ